VGLQTLENKALSWGIIRRSAYILAEITVRKSQVIKAAELKTWQHRAEEKLLPFALAAEQVPNSLPAQVFQDLTRRISAKLAVRREEVALVVAEGATKQNP
jgi:hypothetical protein